MEWSSRAIDEFFEYARLNERKNLDKIEKLYKQLKRDPVGFAMGSERLKGNLSGLYSRKINKRDRFVFNMDVTEEGKPNIYIVSIKNHY